MKADSRLRELIRTFLYPPALLIVLKMALDNHWYVGEVIDPNVYWNLALLTTAASLFCHVADWFIVDVLKLRL